MDSKTPACVETWQLFGIVMFNSHSPGHINPANVPVCAAKPGVIEVVGRRIRLRIALWSLRVSLALFGPAKGFQGRSAIRSGAGYDIASVEREKSS